MDSRRGDQALIPAHRREVGEVGARQKPSSPVTISRRASPRSPSSLLSSAQPPIGMALRASGRARTSRATGPSRVSRNMAGACRRASDLSRKKDRAACYAAARPKWCAASRPVEAGGRGRMSVRSQPRLDSSCLKTQGACQNGFVRLAMVNGPKSLCRFGIGGSAKPGLAQPPGRMRGADFGGRAIAIGFGIEQAEAGRAEPDMRARVGRRGNRATRLSPDKGDGWRLQVVAAIQQSPSGPGPRVHSTNTSRESGRRGLTRAGGPPGRRFQPARSRRPEPRVPSGERQAGTSASARADSAAVPNIEARRSIGRAARGPRQRAGAVQA